MATPTKYVLVTIEDDNDRVPKVLEDYIYSLNIFDDVIFLKDFTIDYFRQNNYIYVLTQMWLELDNTSKRFIDEVLSSNRVVFLNVEMLSEEIRINHVLNMIKYNIQIADYSMANILFLKEYAKYKNIPIKKDIIYLPYQYNLQDQVQLQNIDDMYIYDIGIINALPEKSDTVDPSNTYRRTKMWNDIQKTKWKCINILGWGKARDEIVKRCKVIINIHHFEAFDIFEHIRCDRMVWAKKIIVSDKSKYMNKLDITPYIYCEEFDNILPKVEKILESFNSYYKNMMKSVPMDNMIENRRTIIKNELKKIECNSHLLETSK